ncbi:PREDICTED: uncharacterized protein LOC109481473 [Branchiostoma belcheri]|uniref:Uncharacterized protein LOC109481473 n=1 Tax=Branchiostoma belcheri TaxID=7741 RepID=A0A6P4ZEA0_BRABE|nr:PREDICTED: uncharacterized protein LOC109481473 [Branchiostoma belcheri]
MPKAKRTAGKDKGKQPMPMSKRTRQRAEESSASDKSETEEMKTTLVEQQTTQKGVTEEQDEQIASFIESHPAFYDITTADYKNKVKKESWLKDVSSTIGLTPKQVMTRFQTMRTDYFKLKRKVAGKSGQGQTKLTPLQDFKLRRYAFLDAHYRGKVASRELGSVPQVVVSSGDDDDVEFIPDHTTGTTSDRNVHGGCVTPPKKKKKKDMTEVLVELLTDSQKELRQSQVTLAQAAGTSGEDERVCWAQWLASLQKDIPSEKWRAYQKDTFAVAMRYTTGEDQQQPTQPAITQLQPLQQHQVIQQQQPVQYMAVPYGFGAPGQQQLATFRSAQPLVSATLPTATPTASTSATMSPLRAAMVTLQNAGQVESEKEETAED